MDVHDFLRFKSVYRSSTLSFRVLATLHDNNCVSRDLEEGTHSHDTVPEKLERDGLDIHWPLAARVRIPSVSIRLCGNTSVLSRGANVTQLRVEATQTESVHVRPKVLRL